MAAKSTTTEPHPDRIHRARKVVSFDSISVIEFAYSIGDNPSCSCGVPVACGGEELERIDFPLEYFEEHRPRRRTRRELTLSKNRRRSLLKKSGYSNDDLEMADHEIKKSKKGRLRTLQQIRLLQRVTVHQISCSLQGYYIPVSSIPIPPQAEASG